ncbi:multidrug resistance protein MdtN [Thiorhodovibrio winogradskyi]|uniref:Multidrug resistance protein MdtN n=1 Tax=Thiorhodovibrio winogradskyi TaxID=77007 RepID=A0ABZ0SGU9_9GAMM|nr:efflux RND transporter periplasmic adaptor subunit [Thiorhodovibrio winogradskyi]
MHPQPAPSLTTTALMCAAIVVLGAQPLAADPRPEGISGFTEAQQDLQLGLSESGRVALISAREGDSVKAGDLILSLDIALIRLDLEQRRLKLEFLADLQLAERRLAMLSDKLQRGRRLRQSDNAISRDELEQIILEHAQAEADLARLRAQKEQERLELALAEEHINRRELRAGFDGILVRLAKAEGESVQPHEPLARLVDASAGRFIGNAEFRQVAFLKPGQRVRLDLLLDGAHQTREGVVSFLSPVMDTASGLIEVKAEFDNRENPVQLGGPAILLPVVSLDNEVVE